MLILLLILIFPLYRIALWSGCWIDPVRFLFPERYDKLINIVYYVIHINIPIQSIDSH